MCNFKNIKIVSWNVRGLNAKEKRVLVRHEIKKEKPHILCLQETKWAVQNARYIKESVGAKLDSHALVLAEGTAGGILLAWDKDMFAEVERKTGKYCVSVDLVANWDSTVIRITGVYGPSANREKSDFFQELKEMKPQIEIPWMVAGDFNVTLDIQDRSNTRYPIAPMMRFRAVVKQLQLINMPLQGRRYTWTREGPMSTSVRLDRFLMSMHWESMYPNTVQRAGYNPVSDHCPIVCTSQTKFPTSNIFRIENSWLKLNQFQDLVQRVWNQEGEVQTMQQLSMKYRALTKEITHWKKGYVKEARKQKTLCAECIAWLVEQKEDRGLTEVEEMLEGIMQQRHNQIVMQDEEKWKQRAKRTWVKLGDKNTNYFHKIASMRKRKSNIDVVVQEDIQVIEHKQKAKVFFDYFVGLIGTQHNQEMQFDYSQVYQSQPQMQQLHHLAQPITVQEVQETIAKMPANKAPGPDGYTGEFYKKFATIMVSDLVQAYNHMLQMDTPTMWPMDDSYIALVPKKEGALKTTDYRPLSLINSVQKIFSKVMANRLKPVIGEFVDHSQTGFMQNRYINEGFLYAQELVTMATKQRQKVGLFKADIFKAFDTLSWDFLEQILRAKGFPERWIKLVVGAIVRGSSRVIMNSVAGKKINLRRGVRQGDPMSPYLFILAMDFLAKWTNRLVQLELFQVPLPNCKPCLLFANDTLFILQPTTQQMQFLKIILNLFQKLAGLKVNLEKSELVITTAEQHEVQQMARLMNCKETTFPITYLGMPLSNKRLKKEHYNALIHKIDKKLPTWKASLLSIGGRITLINAVLTAIPVYMMQTFILPKWVIKRIDKARRKFLWHGHKTQGDRYLSLAAWELVTKPKRMGGLGIKDMQMFNQALMAKIMWKWIQPNKPEWMEIIVLTNLVQKPWELSQTTAFWKNLAPIAPFFNMSVSYKLGNGKHIQFWNDRWIQGPLKERYRVLYEQSGNKNGSVHEIKGEGNWNFCLGSHVSEEVQTQEQLLREELEQQGQLREDQEDEVVWKWTKEGKFTVKSFYNERVGGPYIGMEISKVWTIKAPTRVQVFIWFMLQDKILTIQNLKRRGWEMPNRCSLCCKQEETVKHMFMLCQYTKRVMQMVERMQPEMAGLLVRGKYKHNILNAAQRKIKEIKVVICFIIWRERCAIIFRDEKKVPTIIAREILQEYRSWFDVH